MKNKPILFSILALAMLGSCKSATTIVENDVGIIQGNVHLYNIEGDSIPSNGATISIEGTSFQSTSNTNGIWQLNNIPAGIYNIIITKPGFDTSLTTQYQFSGAGTQFLEGEVIQAVPFDSVTILSVTAIKNDSINGRDTNITYSLTLEFNVSGPDSLTLQNFFWVAADTRVDSNLQEIENGHLTYYVDDFASTIPSSRPFTISKTGSYPYSLDSYLWKPGDTLYVETRAYATSIYGASANPGALSPYIYIKKLVLP